MLIPPINSKGIFELAVPFDKLLSPIESYTVTAIRSINELLSDDPLTNIYLTVGLTKEDMEDDAKNNIPIIVLMSTGGKYLYVPGDMFLTVPKTIGQEHQEKVLTISLGLLPSTFDFNLIKTVVKNHVYDICGIEAIPSVTPSSAAVLLDDVTSKKLRLLRENKATIYKSDLTKYNETLELLNKKNVIIEHLECYIKKTKEGTC